MKNNLAVTIIGSGNVATHLYKALASDKKPILKIEEVSTEKRVEVTLVNSRTLENLPDHSDIILISVKDDAIAEVAEKVKGKASIIAHTSGSVRMEVLGNYAEHFGVFYPLQTFSKDKQLEYHNIPFFIEGDSQATVKALRDLANEISTEVFEADSNKRKKLHIAAVFACNFSNHLVAIADELLKEEDMDYRVLMPLLKETVKKLESLRPIDAQTGPAVRKDKTVMAAHEEMLNSEPHWKAIYTLLSSSIQDMAEKSHK